MQRENLDRCQLQARLAEAERLEAADDFGPNAIAANLRTLELAEQYGPLYPGAEHASCVRLAEAAEHAGDFAEMERWFEEANRRDPSEAAKKGLKGAQARRRIHEVFLPNLTTTNKVTAYINVGKEQRRRGTPEEAITIYLAGRQHLSETPELLNAIAGALRDLGDVSGAAVQARRSLELAPSFEANRAGHVVMGHIECDRGQYATAYERGLQLVRAHAQDSFAHFLIGRAAVARRDSLEEGLAHIRRADELAEESFDVLPWLRELYRELQREGAADRANSVAAVGEQIVNDRTAAASGPGG